MKDIQKTETGVVREEISLREVVLTTKRWFHYILKKKLTILVWALIGSIGGLAFAYFVPPKYVANTFFVLESPKKGNDYSSIAAKFGFGGSSGGGLFQEDNNIISLMRSRSMVSMALFSTADFGSGTQLLIDQYIDFKGYRAKWADKKALANLQFHVDPAERSRTEDSMVGKFYERLVKKNLYVGKPDPEEDVILVSTVTENEQFSKAFNTALLNNVTTFYITNQTLRSQQNVDILQHQVDSIRGLLNIALSGVGSSSDANPNLNPAFQRLRVPSQKRMVDVEMNKAILTELVKNLELSKINLRKETPLIQVIDEPVLPLEKKKTGKLLGMLMGGILFAVLAVLYLSLVHFFQSAMREEMIETK
jgi:capsule polysaccharide export protein KpsE/RkpR